MELKDLYREVILDHNRSPRHFGRLQPADTSADGHNPLCGDQLHVSLRLDGELLRDFAFEGQGCAISVASASLMSEAVIGRTRAEIDALHATVHAMLTGSGEASASLGKLQALAGVREFPARVKCASLAWHTLQAALHAPGAPATSAASSGTAAAAPLVSTE